MGVLFAVGAVSGTILSFEMGMLWPGLMETFGEVYGFPFTLEGFAFFLEAIFVGIYLFGWDRLSPKAHMLTAVPIIVSGAAGAFFVVAANAWMNTPEGFSLRRRGAGGPRPLGRDVQPVDRRADGAHAARRRHGRRILGRLGVRRRHAAWPAGALPPAGPAAAR